MRDGVHSTTTLSWSSQPQQCKKTQHIPTENWQSTSSDLPRLPSLHATPRNGLGGGAGHGPLLRPAAASVLTSLLSLAMAQLGSQSLQR